MTPTSFSNDKARVLNEILESARSLNNNGTINCVLHLEVALKLLRELKMEHKI